jgi:hypothetical protein
MCLDLSRTWGGATVILSPQNIYPTIKLKPYSESIRKLGGSVLFDPQLYAPSKFQKNLQKHDYWPREDFTSIELSEYNEVLKRLADINLNLHTEMFILPSRIIDRVDDQWGKDQDTIASQARIVAKEQQLLLTVALGKDVLMNDIQVESIIHYAHHWDIDGVYIVSEHPEHYYLVDKPIWIANLMSLIAGIKRLGKFVVVGYANHQMLPLSLAKCDAIAAGSFLNARWFKAEHFETSENKEPSQRTKWFYCPQTLSEFKVAYLDVAHRSGILNVMATPSQMENEFSNMLFGGAIPSSTNYEESDSFKHYLHCLRIQCEFSSKFTYIETRNYHFAQLETAAQLLTGLHNERIKGQDRDFNEICDVNAAAIQLFDKEFGFAIAREWDIK